MGDGPEAVDGASSNDLLAVTVESDVDRGRDCHEKWCAFIAVQCEANGARER